MPTQVRKLMFFYFIKKCIPIILLLIQTHKSRSIHTSIQPDVRLVRTIGKIVYSYNLHRQFLVSVMHVFWQQREYEIYICSKQNQRIPCRYGCFAVIVELSYSKKVINIILWKKYFFTFVIILSSIGDYGIRGLVVCTWSLIIPLSPMLDKMITKMTNYFFQYE